MLSDKLKRITTRMHKMDNVQEIQDYIGKSISTLANIEEGVNRVETILKSFLDMQSMIGEEIINAFEVVLGQLKSLQNPVTQNASNPVQKEESVLNEQSKDKPENGYDLQAMVDMERFLSLQRYLSEQKCTGKGEIERCSLPIRITYYEGKIVEFTSKYCIIDPSLGEFAKYLESFRVKEWENETEENLIQMLACTIQNKAKYLAGLTRVLQQLNKKQLIERLQTHAPAFLTTNEDGIYTGEALFHYLLQKWTDQGKGFLCFSFHNDISIPKPDQDLISIPVLLRRAEQFVKYQEKKGVTCNA